MRIKLTVSTGWANGDHVEYIDLPHHWEALSNHGKENYLHSAATESLHDCCSAYGEVVEDEEDE